MWGSWMWGEVLGKGALIRFPIAVLLTARTHRRIRRNQPRDEAVIPVGQKCGSTPTLWEHSLTVGVILQSGNTPAMWDYCDIVGVQ
jgi:hypothetical protein